MPAACFPAVQAAGCDAKIASGGGRMGVTMDRCELLGFCLPSVSKSMQAV
jgi:hypothetical protein